MKITLTFHSCYHPPLKTASLHIPTDTKHFCESIDELAAVLACSEFSFTAVAKIIDLVSGERYGRADATLKISEISTATSTTIDVIEPITAEDLEAGKQSLSKVHGKSPQDVAVETIDSLFERMFGIQRSKPN